MFVVHQPYFAPWLGYFAKLVYAPNFYLLDDVLFSKRHNIDKAVIVGMNSEPLSLNIPCGENLGKRINDIYVNDVDFISRILKSIEYSYKTSKLFKAEWKFVSGLFEHCMDESNRLDLIDFYIIKSICEYLELNTNFKFSSNYPCENRTDRIILASTLFQDKELLVGDGKSLDVHDLSLLKQNKISVYQLSYNTYHPVYFQCRRQKAPFLKSMSIVDALLNVGREEVIKLLKTVKPVKIF